MNASNPSLNLPRSLLAPSLRYRFPMLRFNYLLSDQAVYMNHAVLINDVVRDVSHARRVVLLYILSSDDLYGADKMALATALGLKDRFDPVIFAPKGRALEQAKRLGLETREFSGTKDFIKKLFPYLVKQFELVFFSTGVVHSVALTLLNLIYRRKNIHVHVVHDGVDEKQSYGRRKILNWFGIELVAVSDFGRDRLIANGVNPKRITVIENFLDEDKIRRIPQREAFSKPGIKKVIVVSKAGSITRIDLLLDALDHEPRLSALDVHIFGNDPDLDVLRARAQRRNPNVQFDGVSLNLKEHLVEADLLLHLSPEEPLGPGILEAFAARVPVLVPDIGNAGTSVLDSVSGFRFRANNADALARRLVKLLNVKPVTLNAVVEGGLYALRHRFSATRGIEEYQQLLDGRI